MKGNSPRPRCNSMVTSGSSGAVTSASASERTKRWVGILMFCLSVEDSSQKETWGKDLQVWTRQK